MASRQGQEIVVISPRARDLLNGNVDRELIERCLDGETKFRILPGSEYQGRGRGVGKTFVRIRSIGLRRAVELTFRTDLLDPVSRD